MKQLRCVLSLLGIVFVVLTGVFAGGCSQVNKTTSTTADELERAIRAAQVQSAPTADQQPTFVLAALSENGEGRLEQARTFTDVLKADLQRLPESLWDDTKLVYTDKNNLIVLLLAGGASLTVRNTFDDTWEDHFRRHRSFKKDWGDAAGVMGNPGVHLALAAGAYAYGLKTQDTKTYSVGKTLMNALIITDLSTVLLKVAANTSGPNGENVAWPSGHTSSPFCFAAVLDEAYGHKVGIPLYLAAAFVAFERMDDREHHFSDIVFGAALGYVIGKTVARDHAPEILGGKLVPYIDPYFGESGLAWMKEF